MYIFIPMPSSYCCGICHSTSILCQTPNEDTTKFNATSKLVELFVKFKTKLLNIFINES